MGYTVVTEQVDFAIPADNVRAALAVLKGTDQIPAADDQCAEALASAIADYGFDVVELPGGAVAINCYCDKSINQDDLVLLLARFAPNGSFIEWRGEDDERWRYLVHNGQLHVQYPHVSWLPDPADESCDECGSPISADVHSLVNTSHSPHCSLHPGHHCDRHGGAWGDDQTCVDCTTADGKPRPRPATAHTVRAR